MNFFRLEKMIRFCHVSCPRSGGSFLWEYLSKNSQGSGWVCGPAKTLDSESCIVLSPHERICCDELIEKGYKVIHLIRNKKDVIYSMSKYPKFLEIIERYLFLFYQDKEHYYSLSDEDKYSLIYDIHVNNAIKFRGHENYLEITYKNLCLDTKKTLKQIEDFIGLKFKFPINIKYSTHGNS